MAAISVYCTRGYETGDGIFLVSCLCNNVRLWLLLFLPCARVARGVDVAVKMIPPSPFSLPLHPLVHLLSLVATSSLSRGSQRVTS